jgi:hypothetical protein
MQTKSVYKSSLYELKIYHSIEIILLVLRGKELLLLLSSVFLCEIVFAIL